MSKTTILKVGFIGLGDQGGPMAHAIAESGFELHIWARRPQSLEAVTGAPYIVEKTVQTLAENCDVVCLCLTDDKDIVALLDNGLRDGLKAGAVLVNHGTGDPRESRRLAAELQQQGITYLDAPVSGGRQGALARTLTTMVGGESQAFSRVRAVFETFSRKVSLLGPSGTGQMAKLLNNALTMSNLKNAVDVFSLGKSVGMDLVQLHDVIAVSSGSSTVLRAINNEITSVIAPHLQGLMRKDIEHFADAIRDAGLNPEDLHNRCLAGADGLVELVGQLAV
ncbi:NAD(P)-dependent oxidoreductase [Pseudomonas sp. N40(2020)]|uniref:NAD(P)-dependent oxidoreductase n=1 Tax=Pseudomonas sp. N40(2020) TaxID=2767798 RepID=UPI001656BC73|nr:NAD(P)-dependent oxidoreductase [Pseudomonas sp. N40(2020)]MBC8999414.1 NAD(P)-dependent oxidoreductase [Pseudomonas sp. N40(2020)]